MFCATNDNLYHSGIIFSPASVYNDLDLIVWLCVDITYVCYVFFLVYFLIFLYISNKSVNFVSSLKKGLYDI